MPTVASATWWRGKYFDTETSKSYRLLAASLEVLCQRGAMVIHNMGRGHVDDETDLRFILCGSRRHKEEEWVKVTDLEDFSKTGMRCCHSLAISQWCLKRDENRRYCKRYAIQEAYKQWLEQCFDFAIQYLNFYYMEFTKVGIKENTYLSKEIISAF